MTNEPWQAPAGLSRRDSDARLAPVGNTGNDVPDGGGASSRILPHPYDRRGGRMCLFVLDASVLMHDPSALFRFGEHDVYLPMAVLEEMDAAGKDASESARNIREVSRILDGIIRTGGEESIEQGLPLAVSANGGAAGRLFLQTRIRADPAPDLLPGSRPDTGILNVARALHRERQDRLVVIVSKEITLRIKARALGISSEDYLEDVVLDDVTLLYPGVYEVTENTWKMQIDAGHSRDEDGRVVRDVSPPGFDSWFPNQCLYAADAPDAGVLVRRIGDDGAVVEPARDYRDGRHTVWGVSARNLEQNFALNLLMDPDVDFVTLLGAAGTGKTLLALAAGLAQTLDEKRYLEIVMTRATVPVGDDIGFLPGTEEEKMTPWMGALMDNLEVLTEGQDSGVWRRAATSELLQSRIRIRSLNFMRGRTFLHRYVILDEAQNLTRHQMKTLITRAGPGTKMVCLGNVRQIDTPWLSETTSGLTHVVDRFKHWVHSGHVTLVRGERSRLADFASESL